MAEEKKEVEEKKEEKKKFIEKLKELFSGKKKVISEKAAKVVEKETETFFKVKLVETIPTLPDIKDKTKIDVSYPIIEPYAKIHIHWDNKLKEVVYEVKEPELSEDEKKVLKLLEEGLTELINISFINIKSVDKVIEFLEKNLRILLDEYGIKVNKQIFLKLMYYIYRDFVGLGKIEPLMKDYFIEDIECNGSKTPIYIVHRKFGHLRTSVVFENNEILTRFVEKLAQRCGKYISYASPLLDGSLPDGSRVNATYTQDVTSRGPTFTIRKFTKIPFTPIQLMNFGTVSPEILAYLWLLIEYGANIMVIGGTGSGKTSFLNAIAFFIPPEARIVSIEDTRELQLMHENWLPAVARTGLGLGGATTGEISLFDLLKESFRQRPDYVIVGEIRGKEAFVLFQGMASGHPSFGTMHAEDVDTMIKRLETAPINLSPSLVEAMDVVCIMIHARVKGKDVRRLKEVVEVVKVGETKETTILNVPFIRDPATDRFYFKTESKMFEKIVSSTGISKEKLIEEFRRRTKILMAMYRKKIFGFKEVQELIHEYYKSPKTVLKKLGVE